MLGIDMGCGAIKLAAMRRHRRGWRLDSFVVQAMPGDIGDSYRLDSAAQREALASALEKIPVRVGEAAVALSSAEAVTRTIRLEAGLSDQDIENRIAVEAGQHLPFAVSDARIDFCRLPVDMDASSPRQDMLLVACRKECVQQRARLLTGLGLRPAVVDLDALALRRVVGETSHSAPLILLDLGAGGFRLHAFTGEHLLYSRTHHSVLPAASGPGPGQESGQEPEQLQRLIQEIKRGIQLFLISTACKDSFNIVLTGGLALTPGLVSGVSTVCGRPVGLIQPPPDVIPQVRIAKSHWHTLVPQLSLALALAMRIE